MHEIRRSTDEGAAPYLFAVLQICLQRCEFLICISFFFMYKDLLSLLLYNYAVCSSSARRLFTLDNSLSRYDM